ncbi:MAG: Trm112 family protein [Euryarchaeota archaeon]|nr:Trm112 family protein [Euryarchaeota archaeon]
MKRPLLDLLACSVCRYHPLLLDEVKGDSMDIEEGTLTCPQCGATYPIIESIPNMIPPKDR